ncbi:MAG: sugar ABC transporter permease [Nocardioidaceae bacterium]
MSSTPPPAAPAGTQVPDEVESPPPVTSATLAAQSEVVAGSLGEYVAAWGKRVRSGESGILPVLAGFVVIVIVFQLQDSNFLSSGNIVNLLVQAATFVLLGMAQVFVLLLGDIDLSLGFTAAVGAVITVGLSAAPHNVPWPVAVAAGLGATTVFGGMLGLITTRLRLPSFVVTLAGSLFMQGAVLYLIPKLAGASSGGTIGITNDFLLKIVQGNMGVVTAWVLLAVVVALTAALMLYRQWRLTTSGLAAPPLGLVVAKIVVLAIAGIALVAVCNTNRGLLVPLRGVPYVVPLVLAVLVAWTFLLGRTKFGRYVYAIGGNAEAARRAGIHVNVVRCVAFMLAGLTAGIAGIVYASRLGSISANVQGGQLVLYAVAAAVIGGTSLFGGRGKMMHALLGGVVIATIYNGTLLIGLGDAYQYMVTALVLLGAVTIDAIARRGRAV